MSPLRTLHVALYVSAFFLPLRAMSAEVRIACPEQLPPESIKADRPPEGWALHMPQEAFLSEGGMLHGDPRQAAYMAPDYSKRNNNDAEGTQTERWEFSPPAGHPTWIYCGYGGQRSPIQLFKRVADDARECTLVTKFRKKKIEGMHFVCK